MQLTKHDLSLSQASLLRESLKNQLKCRMKELPALHPQKRIPNVRDFKITALSNHHPIFEEAGIKKRQFKPSMEYNLYRNGTMNRYISHQIRRLNESVHHSAKF